VHGSDEIFDSVVIFHAGRALDATANVHSVWRDRFDRAGNIFGVQTTGENEKSRKSQCCSRSRPIAHLAGAAAKIRVMCVDEHIAMRKQRHVFRAKLRVRGEYLNRPKFASEFPPDVRREISVQLDASHSCGVCGVSDLIGIAINEDTDCISMARQRLDDLPSSFRFNVARASRIKVEANHVRAKFGAHSRVVRIRNAADFDLCRSHHGKSQTGGRLVGCVTP